LSRLTPIYIKSPSWLRPFIKRLMTKEYSTLAFLTYLISIPIALPFLGIEGIKVTLRMTWRAYRMRGKPINQGA
jgi:hypothetical protein